MISVLIADDHKLVRDGLKSILKQYPHEMQIAGEAASGQEVLDQLEKSPADLVLMDIDMPGMNGIEATRLARERFPGVKVIMLTMADNEQWVGQSLEAGAQGYVLKSAGRKVLLQAIRSVGEGEEYFSPDLTKLLLAKRLSPADGHRAVPAAAGAQAGNGQSAAGASQGVAAISPRELEVLRLIAQGHTNQQIGELLFTSRRTVETHRQNLLEKTKCNNTATLILYAASHGLLDPQ